MPVINFTQKDLSRLKPPDNGWHLCVVKSLDESASKDKASINYQFECEVLKSEAGDQNIGRYCYPGFNSKALGFMIPFICACLDISLDKFQLGEFEAGKLIEKKVYIKAREEAFDGKLVKKYTEFASASAVPF